MYRRILLLSGKCTVGKVTKKHSTELSTKDEYSSTCLFSGILKDDIISSIISDGIFGDLSKFSM